VRDKIDMVLREQDLQEKGQWQHPPADWTPTIGRQQKEGKLGLNYGFYPIYTHNQEMLMRMAEA
jgi:hypothetical protein